MKQTHVKVLPSTVPHRGHQILMLLRCALFVPSMMEIFPPKQFNIQLFCGFFFVTWRILHFAFQSRLVQTHVSQPKTLNILNFLDSLQLWTDSVWTYPIQNSVFFFFFSSRHVCLYCRRWLLWPGRKGRIRCGVAKNCPYNVLWDYFVSFKSYAVHQGCPSADASYEQ